MGSVWRSESEVVLCDGWDFDTATTDTFSNRYCNTDGVLSFDDTAFQVVSGGVQGISFTDIQDESDADPTADATNAVVEIPAGTWDISLEFYGNQEPNENTFLGFYKIQSGVDDVEEFASNNRQQQFFGTADF